MDQLDIIEAEGGSPERFISIHTQEEKDFARNLEVARRGAWIEYDHVGRAPDDEVIGLILKVLGNAALSHDRGWYDPAKPGGGSPVPYTHLAAGCCRNLRARGVDEAAITPVDPHQSVQRLRTLRTTMSTTAKRHFIDLLTKAGIEVGGTRPWDIQVHDERLYGRLLAYGTLGFGEAYMDGWWDAEALDQLVVQAARFRHLRASAARSGAGAERRAGAAAEPAAAQGHRGGREALRHRQRPLRGHARPAHDLFVRLLERRRDARPGAGSTSST